MVSFILVFGWPNSGKSELAKKLDAHGFLRIPVDKVYVDFVHDHYPDEAPPDLDETILQHYDEEFSLDVGRRHHWHGHLLQQIEEAAATADPPKIVVEGCLLGDCRTLLHLHLTSQGHSVIHVRAEQHTYTRVDEGLTIEEVAALVAK